MKAVVFHELGKPLAVEDVDLAPPKAREVRVKVVASGLCHSDIHRLHGHLPSATPMVMGHEGAGIVEEVGEAVTDVVPGDHVVISFGPYCGGCAACSDGRFSNCDRKLANAQIGNLLDGTSRLSLDGQRISHQSSVSSFAQQAVVHESSAVKVPEDAPLETVALLGCGATSGLAPVFNDAQVEAGSSVAVIGVGGLGLNTVQASALSGALTIIAVDLLEHRLEQALEFGATHVINASKSDPIAEVLRISGGGVDYAFEVIGLPETVLQAIQMVRPGGETLVIGALSGDAVVSIPWMSTLRGTIKRSGFGAARPKADIPKYVDLYLAGKLKFDELVTGHFSLAEFDQAVAVMERGEGVRNIIHPNQ
jgi:S-(hydroxymethyl)glutathione dehydrogenase/alcohol dehydrogenase